MLYNLIIAPIEFIVDWIFRLCLNKVGTHGVIYCVVVVSIVINILALPLYNIADALQDKERKIAKKLESRVKRIKKAFKGDEQFMMLSEYYRQNDYHPLYTLRSALSILIEIPFFIAAYHYLSNCEALLGSKFWIFKDLGNPDSLFKFTVGTKLIIINILPIIMTLINFVSGAIYTKDATVKEKVQLYVIAAIFLVLLYNSPSGLVIYWILNNLFSLAKNIVLKTKKPGAVLFTFIAVCLTGATFYFWLKHPETTTWKKCFLTVLTAIFCCIPLIIKTFQKLSLVNKLNSILETKPSKSTTLIFILSSLSLSLFLGLILTTNVLGSSPIEFCNLGSTPNPVSYIFSSVYFFLGFCFIWPLVIYKMFGNKVKNILSYLFPSLLITAVCNAYIFKPDYGTLNPLFVLDDSAVLNIVPLIFSVLSVLIFILFFIFTMLISKSKIKNVFNTFLIALIIAEISLGSYKLNYINTSAKNYLLSKDSVKIENINDINPVYHLTKTGKNVIVLFLDRAASPYLPYVLKQFPELTQKLDGFTYYPNTLSLGSKTLNGYPPLAGGYEYAQNNSNKRAEVLLREKHNEALMVMPKLFLDAGFTATVTDPSFCNYLWKGDLTPYEKIPEINVSEHAGKYTDLYMKVKNINNPFEKIGDQFCSKQIKNFSILQTLTPVFRVVFYNNTKPKELLSTRNFIDHFSILNFLPELTDFENKKNSFIFIGNDSCHEPTFLNSENFELPAEFDIKSLGCNQELINSQPAHYHVFIASIKAICKYIEYLKKNNIYDNTRIIVVADHGHDIKFDIFKNFSNQTLPANFNPLFLIKDFNQTGNLKTDNTFMTNADTLFIAKKDLPVSNINPFTNKELIQEKENGLDCFMAYTSNSLYLMKKTQFPYSKENYHVHDNIFDPANWTKLELDGGNK